MTSILDEIDRLPQTKPEKPLSLLARIRQTYPAAAGAGTVAAAAAAATAASTTAPSLSNIPNGKRPDPTAAAQPRLFVVAVQEPRGFRGPDDPDIVYSPDASLSERRAALEQFEWCNLVEAREAKAKAREKQTTHAYRQAGQQAGQNNHLEIYSGANIGDEGWKPLPTRSGH